MSQTEVAREADDEAALCALAASTAQAWLQQDPQRYLSVGLRGELGAGKTAWVRAMLRGLGYEGRVPSPTYTLMEIYETPSITLIHMDLYRIQGDQELVQLGIRDWPGRPACWVLTEWPERAPQWHAQCDAELRIDIVSATARRICCTALSPRATELTAPFELT